MEEQANPTVSRSCIRTIQEVVSRESSRRDDLINVIVGIGRALEEGKTTVSLPHYCNSLIYQVHLQVRPAFSFRVTGPQDEITVFWEKGGEAPFGIRRVLIEGLGIEGIVSPKLAREIVQPVLEQLLVEALDWPLTAIDRKTGRSKLKGIPRMSSLGNVGTAESRGSIMQQVKQIAEEVGIRIIGFEDERINSELFEILLSRAYGVLSIDDLGLSIHPSADHAIVLVNPFNLVSGIDAFDIRREEWMERAEEMADAIQNQLIGALNNPAIYEKAETLLASANMFVQIAMKEIPIAPWLLNPLLYQAISYRSNFFFTGNVLVFRIYNPVHELAAALERHSGDRLALLLSNMTEGLRIAIAQESETLKILVDRTSGAHQPGRDLPRSKN
ncbi:MAG: hypothetical protein PHS44_03895 [Candidatus Dojkabacteria bacterium]|jgi:hypothetical protein|nr:hypothetical protein [Candidatus Dojkabacteria bacterium]